MAFWIELLGRRYPAVGKELTRLFFRRKPDDGNAHLPSIIPAADSELPSTKIDDKQETETSSLVTTYWNAFEPLRSQGYEPSDPTKFGLAVLMGMHRRRFFTTKQGAIGTGPPSTRVGDKIALLAGSRVPFLIRIPELPSRENDAEQ